MEATKTNETLNEGAKAVEKLFDSTNALMTDMYKKQMDLTTSFYNNLLSSGTGNANMWNQNNAFPSMGTPNWLSNPFAYFSIANMQNPFLSSFDKVLKQITAFNQNLLSTFSNSFSGKDSTFGAMGEEYKKTIETRMEASKEIFNTISEAFNKQLESSMEINKKMGEEINNQMNLVIKQNQTLWSEFFKANQEPVNNEEKKIKDPILYESKNKTKVPVKELEDHK